MNKWRFFFNIRIRFLYRCTEIPKIVFFFICISSYDDRSYCLTTLIFDAIVIKDMYKKLAKVYLYIIIKNISVHM